MPDMPWKDAIEKILADEGGALHYTDIAELIASTGLREAVGATPAATVNATISTSLKTDGDASPYRRVARGEYMLREIDSTPEDGRRAR